MKQSDAAFQVLQSIGAHTKTIVLRDYNGIETGTFRDIDLLIPNVNDVLSAILSEFKSNHIFVLFKTKRLNYIQLVLYSYSWPTTVIVDIWSVLNIKGICYLSYDQLVTSQYLEYSQVYRLSDTQSKLIAAVKCLGQSTFIKEKYMYKGLTQDLRTLLNSCDLLLLLNCQSKGKIYLNAAFLLAKISNYDYQRWLWRILKSSAKKKYVLIYLLGPDGSGKSTLSNFILNELSGLRVKTKFSHGGIHVLPRIQNILAYFLPRRHARILPKTSPEQALSSAHVTSTRNFSFLHLVYYVLDSILCKILLLLTRRNNILHIVDRSMYDILARNGYTNLPSLFKKVLAWATPKPDVCFLLKCDPNTIYRRKPELSPKEIDDQYIGYGNVSDYCRVTDIQTTTLDITRKQFITHIVSQNVFNY